MASDEELERLRAQRLAELRAQQQSEEIKRAKEEADTQKQILLRKILTPEARQRLQNIKLVRPDYAEQVEIQLIQIAQSRRVQLPMDDVFLKKILAQIQSQQRRRDINIRRV